MTSTEPTSCNHCGLPVPTALLRAEAPSYCCAGCETVHEAIVAGGLEKYYEIRNITSTSQATPSGRSYDDLDDPSFLQGFARDLGNNRRSIDLYLDGVSCAACVWLVEKAGRLVASDVDIRLDVSSGVAELQWNQESVPLSRIARQLDRLGHPAHALQGAARDARRQEERHLLARIGVAWAIAGNVMVMAIAMYAGAFDDMDWDETAVFRWVSMILCLPSLLWSANIFFRGAWASLKARVLHMDLPVAIGLGAGYIGGVVNTITGKGEVYFDSVASLIFLLLAGRWLTLRQRRIAGDAASLLYALAPRAARKVDADGQVHDVPVESVVAGDVLAVRAGETLAADGIVIQGFSSMDSSILTGESRPVDVGPSDPVHAGMVNISGLLHVRALQTGAATRVGRLLHAVEDAARRRAPVVLQADRVIGWFVGTVLALTVVTAVVWWRLDPSRALDHAVALLVVTCPCALGLATPLAVQAAIGQAAKRGIFVRGGDALERMALRKTGQSPVIWFDKTGTLTQGKLRLQKWLGDLSVQPYVHVLEVQSAHPLAQALARDLPAATQELEVADIEQVPGGGIAGYIGGERWTVGAPAFVLARCPGNPQQASAFVEELTLQAWTPVLVACGDTVVAAAGIGDTIREDAAACVKALRAMGLQVGILSGDHPQVVAAVAATLQIGPERALGACTPEAKLRQITDDSAKGPVFMVGDGVNDAAALAAATVGISVHGGAEASLAAADVFLTQPGLSAVVDVLRGSRRTLAVIRRNLAFSLGYNVIGASLSIAGLLSPLVAALLMPLSSLTVLTSSWRTTWFGRVKPSDPGKA